MKTLKLPITNGTFLASDVTVSGTNDSTTHNVYVAFTQADSGYVAIQYKVSGSNNWQPMGKVDLTDTEVATFKVSGIITDWRFVVAGASGTGSIEVTDSEKLEDIHPLSFYGETGGMSPDEIGDAVASGRVYGQYGYDIIVLAGQSNMVGRYGPIDSTLDASDSSVYQFGNDNMISVIATDPLDNVDETANTVGPGLSIGKEYAKRFLQHGRKVLLVPVADGGTGFSDNRWNPGDDLAENAILKANLAMKAGSGVNRVVAIMWNQGETDSAYTEGQYYSALSALVSYLRENIATAENAPFIVAQINPSSTQFGQGVEHALETVPLKIEKTSIVGTSDLPLGADSLHYTAASAREMGGRYIDKLFYAADNDLRGGVEYFFSSDDAGAPPADIRIRDVGTLAALNVRSSSSGYGFYFSDGTVGRTHTATMVRCDASIDHSITFKADFSGAGRCGFMMRAHGAGTDLVPYNNIRDGYLLQVNQTDVRVYKFVSAVPSQIGSTVSVDTSLNKHFRLSVIADTVSIEYSSDGDSWSYAIRETDTSFAGVIGGIDYVEGFNSDFGLVTIADFTSSNI